LRSSRLSRGVLIAGLALLAVFGPAAVQARAAAAPERIISLAPNMTEMLFALGLGRNIVGVTTFCDFPEEAKKKPKVGGMSNPSLEAVVALKPDVVVMTTDGNPQEFETRLRSLGIRTYVSTMRRLEELPAGIRDLGKAMGVPERADRLAASLESQIQRHSHSPIAGRSPKVLFVVWPEPLIVAGPGTVIDDALTLLGIENLGASAGISYPKYSIEEVLRRPPDVILVGKGMGRDDVRKISQGFLKKLNILPAVKEGRVFFVGDELYRLGPRTIKGIEELERVLGRRT
jgi:iron complex transport system substrate-binding protein